MKKIIRASLLLSALLIAFSASTATAATTIEKITLQAGESKSFSLAAEAKMKIGFKPELSSEQASQCKNNCIELSQVGGKSFSSIYGGAMGMEPKDGKIELSVKNVETFAIEVEVYHK